MKSKVQQEQTETEKKSPFPLLPPVQNHENKNHRETRGRLEKN